MNFVSRSAACGLAAFALAVSLTGAALAQAKTQTKAPVSPEQLKPPADILLDCAKSAPKDAVTKLPADLAAWAAVYCTKNGQIFNANDRHFGAFPDTGVRATFGAAEIGGRTGADRAKAYFKSISYNLLSDDELAALIKADPISEKIVKGKKLYKLDLVSGNDNVLTFLVIQPQTDPFWVFPLTSKGLGTPAFFVVSLAALNRSR
ncbi:MAG: hypothetical protein ACK5JM_14215 [Rhodoblastus sp.]